MSDEVLAEETPDVSVIIPITKSTRFLGPCLDSLVSQTFNSFEVICVADTACTESLEVLGAYQESDTRIRVIHEVQGGHARLRNRGLAAARGAYVCFLDGNDYVSPELLNHDMKRAHDTNADIVVHDASIFASLSGAVNHSKRHLNTKLLRGAPCPAVFSHRDIPHFILRFISPAPWLKFYRRQFLLENDLTFQEIAYSYDYRFANLTLCCAQRITTLDEQLVFHRTGLVDLEPVDDVRYATCVLQSIESLERGLVDRSLYSTCEQAFSQAALTTIKYVLDTMNVTRRTQLLDRLSRDYPQLLSLLEHEQTWYAQADSYTKARAIKAAVHERNHWAHMESPEPLRPVTPVLPSATPPNVSVIIPAYNAGRWIDDTIASILRQSLKSIEVIVVDDGSTDDTLERLKAWASHDQRVRVFCQPNRGQSVARNAALAFARGSYLQFVDSDDMLEDNALEELYQQAHDNDLDLLFYSGTTFYDEDCDEMPSFNTYYRRKGSYPDVYTGLGLLVAMRRNRDYRASPCMQLMSTNLLKQTGIRFYPGILHEDEAFTFQLIVQARRAAYVDRPYYLRRMRVGSVMTSQPTFAHAYGYYTSWRIVNARVESLRERLSAQDYELLSQLSADLLSAAQKGYRAMAAEQHGAELGLGKYLTGFKKMVMEPCQAQETAAEQKALVAQQRERIAELDKQVNSRAHRMGVALAKPIRILADAKRSLASRLRR